MKSKDLYNSVVGELLTVYPDLEAQSITSMLLEDLYGINQIDLITNNDFTAETKIQDRLTKAIVRLQRYEPVQYVLGKAHFYGRDYTVNSKVLIPRKETEELVHLIINDHQNFNGNILDIGTGSGCIPITLSLEFPQAKVEAIDISEEVLSVAKDNARALNSNVDFNQLDILSPELLPNTFDIIVSNPPYVMNNEKEQMQKNVLDNEPHLALFVENDNPLVFYSAIIQKTTKSLNPNGRLYFEINQQFGKEVAQAMESTGFENVNIIEDMQGKDRIVKGMLI